jgi:hypothetical protein
VTATITQLPIPGPEPRRTIRDQDETLAAYQSRTGQPADAKTTARALAHYTAELQTDLAVAEIFAAGWDACVAAMAAQPHLRLADVAAASVTAIQEAAG